VLSGKINSCMSMRWLQATTRRRCWSSSGISSVSYTKVKVLYDSCLLDGSGFLSKIDLSLLQLEDSQPRVQQFSQELSTLGHIWCVNCNCGLVCSGKLEDFSAPHAAILSGIEYTGKHIIACCVNYMCTSSRCMVRRGYLNFHSRVSSSSFNHLHI